MDLCFLSKFFNSISQLFILDIKLDHGFIFESNLPALHQSSVVYNSVLLKPATFQNNIFALN